MSAISAYAIMFILMGTVPGETTGWGTGEVVFQAYVDTSEHQEIFPICAGQYMVEVSVGKVIEDPMGILEYVTSVEICYEQALGLTYGDIVEVEGIYYDGACPIPYCGRVAASYVYEIDEIEEDEEDDEDDPNIKYPRVVTGSAEPTETTVTLRATLEDDGGEECRCRFIYWIYDERRWYTEWIDNLYSNNGFSQEIAGLTPDTLYFYTVEAENSEEWDGGRTGTFVTLTETVPPIPDPVVWTAKPDQLDTMSIIMTADIARDISGPEEYFFDFVSSPTGGAGGSDPLWQFSPSYTDVGLNPNHQYGYRVKARDGNGNETAYSVVKYAYTAIENPAGVEFGEITTNSIQTKSSNALSGLNRGQSGVKLENVTAGQVSPWRQENTFWASDGLLPNTQYTFRAQARNGDADRTPFSPTADIYTLATVPSSTAFSNVTVNSLLTHWSTNGNPAGTPYWCENTVLGSKSGWITDNQWLDTDLSPNAKYSYHVKARNGDGIETAFSETIHKYSAIEEPQSIVFGTITTDSIQVRSENTPSGLDQAQSGLRFENITAGRMSSWQQDNNFWNSEGLQPNRRYDFRAQARNGDAEQTPYSLIGSAYTNANTPSPAAFTGVTTFSLQAQWGHNGNPPGTLYFCENTTNGTSSGWTILTSWNNTHLQPNIRYTYHVKAQNATGLETDFSAETHKYSAIETPTGTIFGAVTASSIQVKSENTPTGLNRGSSGLRFENVTTSQLSAWQQNNELWTSNSLMPNTLYVFRAQARNGDGDETPYGNTNETYTLANPPVPSDFSYVTDDSIQVNWGTNGNPYGTLYLCQNTTNGTDSGWISGTSWDSVDLAAYTTYDFRVKARNANGLETAWTNLGQETTGDRSLTISSTEGGQVSNPGEDVFHYVPGTTVDVAANAQEEYHFTHWSGSAVDAGSVADPNAASTSVLVDAHYTLVANFLRTRIYVDSRASGANDGSSWANALTSLQNALDMAQKGNEILVAQGIYTPDIGQNRTPGDYTVSFAIPNGAALKGGYAGVGTANPNARDIVSYETILSGDLNGDDARVHDVHDLYGEATRLDNSFHVVTAHDVDNTSSLEGFTISGGNSYDGAGIQLIRSDIVIADCTIRENRVGELSGDGVEGWGQGAGISCFYGEPVLLECKFQFNWAGAWGGAVHSFRAHTTLWDCSFQDNHAGMQGGALYFEDSNGIVIQNSFQGNRSWDGGAIFSCGEGDCRFTNCQFLGNAGFGSGGAVHGASRNLAIINSTFSGNLAFGNGGAVAITDGNGVLTNCTFNNNAAEANLNGETLAIQQANAVFTNCIIRGQTSSSRPQIIVMGTPDRNAHLEISYCNVSAGTEGIVREGSATFTWGSGNIDSNPLFQNPNGGDKVAGTLDDDLRIRLGSSCIDAGDNTAVPADADDLDGDDNRPERIPIDLGGLSRFVDDAGAANTGVADSPDYPAIVDMGAYEFAR
ncbi:MAG: hypothetical protein JW715_15880 [Sedimentisphaerales bacterium]|nr:hypothetical protein [Sedimentisphaerales bacterium]